VVVISSKARTRHEVQQNARFAIERIVRDARSATDVNTGTSTFDVHPSVLSLAHDNPLRDPTIFSVSGGRLQVMEGSNGPYYLTSSDVTVTNFIVNDRSVSGRTKNLKIALTMQYANAASVEFNTSFDVQTAVVIRVQE